VRQPETLARIRELRIPPAWRDVWICPDPLGHLQATGVDAAGRKQYVYHEQWRNRRDREKFDRMLEFAARLPALRSRVGRDLTGDELGRDRVLACATRLLDRGLFRIGSEGYAEDNGTYGLATLKKHHIRLGPGDLVTFDYASKGGKRRRLSIADSDVLEVVSELQNRSRGRELLAYRKDGRWVDVRSQDINAYIKDTIGDAHSAKDFRTWNATVLAAISLAVGAPGARSPTARKRLAVHAVREVAYYLGNTPAVCRTSYIDPRVFDRFDSGMTIRGVLDHLGDDASGRPESQQAIDDALLALLQG
jgi:DNA topoisomerase IB